MNDATRKPAREDRPANEGRGLYEVLLDVSQYALALARTYETRRPRLTKRGPLHSV